MSNDDFKKDREAAAETYATDNHSTSFPDTIEQKAFNEGADWANERAHGEIRELKTKLAFMMSSAQQNAIEREVMSHNLNVLNNQMVNEIREGTEWSNTERMKAVAERDVLLHDLSLLIGALHFYGDIRNYPYAKIGENPATKALEAFAKMKWEAPP